MATLQQQLYAAQNQLDLAKSRGGASQSYMDNLASKVSSLQSQISAAAKPVATGGTTTKSTTTTGLPLGNISLPVSGFTVNPSSVSQTVSGTAVKTNTGLPSIATTTPSQYTSSSTPAPLPAPAQVVTKKDEPQTSELEMLFQKYFGNAPKVSTPAPYQNPLSQEMLDTLAKIKGKGEFSYNPDSDAALKVAQKQGMLQVKNAAVANNRLYGSNTDNRMQEVAQGLIPQYQQMAENTYNTGVDRLYQQLAALQGMDTANYNRYRDNVGDVRANELNAQQLYGSAMNFATGRSDTAFNQQIAQAPHTGQLFGQATQQATQQQRNNEIATYGTELSPAARQGMSVYQSMLSDPRMASVAKQVQSYYSDFAKEINTRLAANPNDPLIPYLMAARTAKILSSPELMQKYGADIGIANPAVANLAMQFEAAQLSSKLDELKGQLAAEKDRVAIEKVQAEIEKLNWEAAYKQLEYINLPMKQKAEIQSEIALAAQRSSAAAENYAGVSLKKEQINTEKAQQDKISADTAKTLAALDNNTSAFYNSFVASGAKFDDWIKSPAGTNANGKTITYAESMTADEFKELVAAAKATGKFDASKGMSITTSDGKTITIN